MIQVQSWLRTMDNCGARYVECIKTFGGFNRKIAYPGDFILVSIKQLKFIRKVRVGQTQLAVITRARKEVRFLDGTSSKAENNVIIVLNKKKRIIGTRIFGWVSRNLRKKKFLRIIIACGKRLL